MFFVSVKNSNMTEIREVLALSDTTLSIYWKEKFFSPMFDVKSFDFEKIVQSGKHRNI